MVRTIPTPSTHRKYFKSLLFFLLLPLLLFSLLPLSLQLPSHSLHHSQPLSLSSLPLPSLLLAPSPLQIIYLSLSLLSFIVSFNLLCLLVWKMIQNFPLFIFLLLLITINHLIEGEREREREKYLNYYF